MKCKEIDIIEFIDGNASKEAQLHIARCTSCSRELEKMMKLANLISTQYVKGKKLERELDRRLQSIEISKMKELPDTIVKKISELREKSLMSKLKKVIGESKRDAKGIIEGFLTPRMHAVPASPKDITKN